MFTRHEATILANALSERIERMSKEDYSKAPKWLQESKKKQIEDMSVLKEKVEALRRLDPQTHEILKRRFEL